MSKQRSEDRPVADTPIEQLVDPADNPADGPQALERLLARARALEPFTHDEEPTFSLIRVRHRS